VPTSRATLGVLLIAAIAAWPSAVRAWSSREHVELGRESYAHACADLLAAIAPKGAPAPPADVAGRLEIACGRNLDTLAQIYGDATALAGDFLDHPSEFISQAGAWRFKSRKSYWLLALENSEHFNPMATQSWAEYHAAAIAEALAAARDPGLGTVMAFQRALQESAFADHFLSDSFAAGHMGFNRTASSAGAAKAFHDTWNKRGRIVSDRNGDRWVTFGDGNLGLPHNLPDGRRHVLDAATLSIRGVLRAFVLGERSPEEELAVWRALPFVIQAPELDTDIVEIFERKETSNDRQLVPLITTIRPVRKDTVLTGSVWSAAPFTDGDGVVVAAVAGLELAIPRIPAQSYLGAGGTLREPGDRHSLVVDTGVLVPVGVSFRSLVSHQLNLTASWLIRSNWAAVLHAEYQVNVELGEVMVSLKGGLAEFVPHPQIGWYGAFGFGMIFSAAGGGSF
jgi:hypothetical protein